MKLFRLAILIFIYAEVGAQTPSLINTWKTYPVPFNEDTLYKYNSDPNDWYVFSNEEKIFVGTKSSYFEKQALPFETIPDSEQAKIFQGRRSVIKVKNGYLVGFNRGEFGGLLFWYSSDGKEKYKIANGNFIQFVIRNSKIYVIEGLAHMFSSKGSIICIEENNDSWVTGDSIILPTAPKAIRVDSKNNFIVVTSASLLSIDQNHSITFLIKQAIWDSYLYPTSSIIHDDVLFIGMRKGVFKFDLNSHEQFWLLPN